MRAGVAQVLQVVRRVPRNARRSRGPGGPPLPTQGQCFSKVERRRACGRSLAVSLLVALQRRLCVPLGMLGRVMGLVAIAVVAGVGLCLFDSADTAGGDLCTSPFTTATPLLFWRSRSAPPGVSSPAWLWPTVSPLRISPLHLPRADPLLCPAARPQSTGGSEHLLRKYSEDARFPSGARRAAAGNPWGGGVPGPGRGGRGMASRGQSRSAC